MKKLAKLRSDIPFNELPPLPPDQIKVETISVLRSLKAYTHFMMVTVGREELLMFFICACTGF